jgi:hypothetical protein
MLLFASCLITSVLTFLSLYTIQVLEKEGKKEGGKERKKERKKSKIHTLDFLIISKGKKVDKCNINYE